MLLFFPVDLLQIGYASVRQQVGHMSNAFFALSRIQLASLRFEETSHWEANWQCSLSDEAIITGELLGKFQFGKRVQKYSFSPTGKFICLLCGQHLKIHDQRMQQMKQASNPSNHCVQTFKMHRQKLQFSAQFEKFHVFYIHI